MLTLRQLGRCVLSSKNNYFTRLSPLRRCYVGTAISLVDGEGINVDWAGNGGTNLKGDYFHGIWLRHNCQCPTCFNVHSDQRTVEADLLPNFRLAHAEVNGDNVELAWETKTEEVHKGYIPLQWLKDHRYPDALSKDHKETKPNAVPISVAKEVPEVEYEEVMSGDKGLWRWLWNLTVYGLCMVNNTPTVLGTIKTLAERIDYIHQTMYGKIFDVVAIDKPDDVAFTSDKLTLHMDMVFCESPPGLQMLHCLKNEALGGESLLLDCLPVLEEMRTNHPEEFHTLTRIPATFQRISYKREQPVYVVTQRPHVTLGINGEIAAFYWSRSMEGPLNVPSADVEPYYKAYTLLAKMIKTSDKLLRFRLTPGQVITMNNRRILHGRDSYGSRGERHLQGTYIGYNEFTSRFHTLNSIYGASQ